MKNQLEKQPLDLSADGSTAALRTLIERAGFVRTEIESDSLLFDLNLIAGYPPTGKVRLHLVLSPNRDHVRVTLLSVDSTFKREDDLNNWTTGLSVYVLLDTDLTPEGLEKVRVLCQVFSMQHETAARTRVDLTPPA